MLPNASVELPDDKVPRPLLSPIVATSATTAPPLLRAPPLADVPEPPQARRAVSHLLGVDGALQHRGRLGIAVGPEPGNGPRKSIEPPRLVNSVLDGHPSTEILGSGLR